MLCLALFAAFAAFVAGCSEPPMQKPPETAPPVGTATSAAQVASGPPAAASSPGVGSASLVASAAPAASASAAPRAPALPEVIEPLPDGSEMARLVAPLFEKGRAWRYRHGHVLNSHSGERDPFMRSQIEARCEVSEVGSVGPARTSVIECKALPNGKGSDDPPALIDDLSPLPEAFVLLGQRLWALEGSPPSTIDELAALAQEPATLRHPLAPFKQGKLPEPDPQTGQLSDTCQTSLARANVVALGKSSQAWCANQSCAAMYGIGSDTLCFLAGVGVVSRDRTNRMGPRVEKVRLVGRAR